MGKYQLLTGAAIGYILGSRAGRGHYDALADQAQRLWGNPKVQEKVHEAKDNAPAAAAKFGDMAMSAASSTADAMKHSAGAVKDKVTGGGDDDEFKGYSTSSTERFEPNDDFNAGHGYEPSAEFKRDLNQE